MRFIFPTLFLIISTLYSEESSRNYSVVRQEVIKSLYSAPWKKVILLSENGDNQVISDKKFVSFLQFNIEPIEFIPASSKLNIPTPPKNGIVIIFGPTHGLDDAIRPKVFCIFDKMEATNRGQEYILIDKGFHKKVAFYKHLQKSLGRHQPTPP